MSQTHFVATPGTIARGSDGVRADLLTGVSVEQRTADRVSYPPSLSLHSVSTEACLLVNFIMESAPAYDELLAWQGEKIRFL